MSDALDRASYALATKVEALAIKSRADGAVMVKAYCWLLAGLIVQSSRAGSVSLDQALRVCLDQLIQDTARLSSGEPPETVQ